MSEAFLAARPERPVPEGGRCAPAEANAAPQASPLTSDFVKALVMQVRAHDTFGSWEGTPDPELLEDFIVTREQRKTIPIIGDPDPDVLWRIELFYSAVGLTIERRSGCMATCIMKMSHEGWGRVVLVSGRLVVVSRHLRDVHRFGFDSLNRLAEEGTRLVAEGLAMIERFPEAAKA